MALWKDHSFTKVVVLFSHSENLLMIRRDVGSASLAGVMIGEGHSRAVVGFRVSSPSSVICSAATMNSGGFARPPRLGGGHSCFFICATDVSTFFFN